MRALHAFIRTLVAVGVACAVAVPGALGAPGAAAPALPAPGGPPWLGVVINDGVHGVLVSEIIAGTPADDAGLLPGDEILAVAGAPVTNSPALQSAIAARGVAERVHLTVWRAGQVLTLPVMLGPRLGASEILHRRLAGQQAPAFDVSVVAGDEAGSLDALRGRAVLIWFFETHAHETASMHQRLSRLAGEHGRDALAVVAASNEQRTALASWIRAAAPSFTVLHDLHGMMRRAYRVERTPALVVVDRGGEVRYAGVGADALEHAIFVASRLAGRSERRAQAR